MKVIFIQDVSGVAKRNDVREVADGYAMNFLLPRGLAVRATPEKLQVLSQQRQAADKASARALATALRLSDTIKGRVINLVCPAAATGTLYAALPPALIAAAIGEQLGVRLSPHQIIVSSPIKTIGEYQIQVNLHPQVRAEIGLRVTAKK